MVPSDNASFHVFLAVVAILLVCVTLSLWERREGRATTCADGLYIRSAKLFRRVLFPFDLSRFSFSLLLPSQPEVIAERH